MRCPSCNKFVPYGEGRIDVDEVEVDPATGAITAHADLTLDCGECGEDLKSAGFDFDVEDEAVKEHLATRGPHELAVAGEDGEPSNRQEGVGRYAKTFYGVEIGYAVTCARHPKWSAAGTLSDDCQASGMDELV